MKHLLFSIFKKLIGSKGFELYKKYRSEKDRKCDLKKARVYLNNQNRILEQIKAKDVKKIVFFVLNMGMWKYDGLIQLLKKDTRFEVTVVSFDMPQFNKSNSEEHQKRIREYCIANDLNFIPGYNYQTNQYADLTNLNPDIVSYTQPYNIGYTPWLIDAFKEHSLFIYTPYGISVTDGRYLYDTYLTNIAWKIFVGSNIEKEYLNRCLSVNSGNQVVTGFSIYDQLNNPSINKNPWSSMKKKVIWAPHHSIDNKFSFSSSNFERICNEMVELAKKYHDLIEFAFKPHPILKERLIEKWGIEKADKYYRQWEGMPNTFICEGDYAELFAYSDGIIHDCASFVCEYLMTTKPALYVVNGSDVPEGVSNEIGIKCFNQHYHAKEISEIDIYLRSIIIEGNDILKNQRISFVNQYLIPPHGNTVGQNMMNELLELTK